MFKFILNFIFFFLAQGFGIFFGWKKGVLLVKVS